MWQSAYNQSNTTKKATNNKKQKETHKTMNIELIKVVDILARSRLNESDINSIVYRLVDSVAISTLSKTMLLIELHQHIKSVQEEIN